MANTDTTKKLKIKLVKEPSPHAKEKGFKKGMIFDVEMSGLGENRNFVGQYFFSVFPPIGRAMYAFYDEEVEVIRD